MFSVARASGRAALRLESAPVLAAFTRRHAPVREDQSRKMLSIVPLRDTTIQAPFPL